MAAGSTSVAVLLVGSHGANKGFDHFPGGVRGQVQDRQVLAKFTAAFQFVQAVGGIAGDCQGFNHFWCHRIFGFIGKGTGEVRPFCL